MLVKVDWISFSVKFAAVTGQGYRGMLNNVVAALGQLSPTLMDDIELGDDWTLGGGRAPYSDSYTHPLGGMTLFVHPRLPHALVEISGRGCDLLAEKKRMKRVLAAVQERVTRVDLACDMLCETRPKEFAEARAEGRFKAQSHVISESGETFYVGSRSSNRYARVYRYNPPHERSMLLRSEFVLKAEDAKFTVEAILEHGRQAVARNLGEKFGWQHPSWKPAESEEIELQVYRPDRREGKTLFWLADTVAPLLARLHDEGVIDVRAWFDENVIPRVNTPTMNAAKGEFVAWWKDGEMPL